MRNKETGEFELFVGDKQLLSAFFILVVLLAVVFAMGYEVGQNSPRAGKTDLAASTPPAATIAEPAPETTEDLRVHLIKVGDAARLIDEGEMIQALHAAPLLRYLLGRSGGR